MFGEEAFTVEGVISEVLSERTCRAVLANGHELFGFVPGRQEVPARLAVGQKIILKLSPYDLSEGRILIETNRALL